MRQRYLSIKNGGANNGGMRDLTPPSPPSWLVYFGVEDVDAGARQAWASSAAPSWPGRSTSRCARIAVVADPQGAVFALYAGELED